MLSNQKSSRFYSVKGFIFTAIALALLMSVTAFASGNSRLAFIDSATEFFGLQTTNTAPVSLNTDATAKVTSMRVENSTAFVNVSVSLPTISATPGTVAVPITVGDVTGQSVISYDLNVDYTDTVLLPAGGLACTTNACFTQSGTMSSLALVTPNTQYSGHFIVSAFQAGAMTGSGTLLILNFQVIGAPGTNSPLTFADYTDPSSAFHGGFVFNEGDPTPAPITNGQVNIPAATATNTDTPTPSATNTSTATNTATNTNTPTPTNTATPTSTATNTFTPTPTPACGQVDIQDQDVLNGQTNVVVAVTTSDTTALIPPAFSADFHITFDPSVLTVGASPNYGVSLGSVTDCITGNCSSLTVNLQGGNVLLISVFSNTQMTGAGTLVNITFPTVTGPPGTFSPITFTPFINHPTGFMFNEGAPTSCATDGSVSIRGQMSGNVKYRPVSAVQPRNVPNVTLTSAGGSPLPGPATTDFGGNYTITGFGPFGYTVTPSRPGSSAPNTHGSSINAFDAALVAQHVVGLIVLSPDQQGVANVTGSLNITSFDSAKIALWAVSLPNTIFTGDWRFSPSVRTYASVGNIIGENYLAYLMGDVSGNWCDPTSIPVLPCNANGTVIGELRAGNGPTRETAVTAPKVNAPAGSDIVVPVSVQGAANKGIISYQFDLKYDPKVILPQANAVTLAGTVSSDLSVVVNANTPGLMKVAVYGPYAISDSGVLLNFHFTAVGNAFDVSPLTWENFIFNDGGFRMNIVDGQVRLTPSVANTTEVN